MRWIARILLVLSHLLSASAISAAGVDRAFEGSGASVDWKSRIAKTLGGGRSYAILIGVSEYSGKENGGFEPLQATRNDVERMRRFLLDQAGFDYVHVLTEENVTRDRIDQLMVDFFPGRVTSRDRFLLYWSGHGVARRVSDRRTEGYLPLRTSQRTVYSSMVSMDDIRRWDELLQARQTLFVLDACVSGLAGQESKADTAALTIEQLGRPSRHLLAAGAAEEEVIAGAKWGGSLFTDAFIRAASGAAAPQGAGVIGLSDLLSYVRRQVAFERTQANWDKPIAPQLRQLRSSDGEFYFIASTLGASAMAPPTGTVSATPAAAKGDLRASSEKVTFAADIFFDFDKTVLKPEGRAKLDDLVAKIETIKLEVITAVGHHDPSAPLASSRRVDAIKSYLVSKGIEANRIYTEPGSSRQPVASDETAEGRAKNRRVELEVVGTRIR